MKLLEKFVYAEILMMIMVTWVVPMSYVLGSNSPMTTEEAETSVTDNVADPPMNYGDETGAPTSQGEEADMSNTGTPTSQGEEADKSNTGAPTSQVEEADTSNTGAPTSQGGEADMSNTGDVANPPNGGDGTDELNTGWIDARATFYGDINGGETQQGACGYGDLHKQGYGLETAALSMALFNNGYTCGACYEIKCVNTPQWCLPGSIKITATNYCPPDYSKTTDVWCNPPQKHFDLSQPMFLKIAKYKAGVVPVKYRRVPCAKSGGVKFEIKGNPHFLMILPYNVGGAGDIKAMQVKGTRTEWLMMKKNWGQIWVTGVVLTGQCLSFRITTSDGVTKDFIDVTPSNWGFDGQSFDGKDNF